MSRWLWIILAVMISTGVYFTIRYGLRPKPIPVLNPTEFENLKQVGVVLYKRLHQNIRTERIVMLGSSEDVKNYEQIWLGLAESALADKEKLVVFVREGLKASDIPGVEVVTFTMNEVNSGTLFKNVASRVARKQLVVVHARTPEITHLIKNSMSQKLDSVVGHPVLALSSLRFAIGEADVNSLQPQCLDPTDADDGIKLHCAAYKVARKFLKKRLEPTKIWAVAERHGLKEFLVFIHQP
jgi:hypothetical protein